LLVSSESSLQFFGARWHGTDVMFNHAAKINDEEVIDLRKYKSQPQVEQLSFDSIFDTLDEEMDQESAKTLHTDDEVESMHRKLNRNIFPIQLIIDFDQFLNEIEHQPKPVHLTKTNKYISKKFLPALNEQMSIKSEVATSNSQQPDYPYIHFFYHLAVGGHLVEIIKIDTNKPELRVTERIKLYKKLTGTEKYFFLFETFWVDMNWSELLGKMNHPVYDLLTDVFKKLMDKKSGFHLNFNRHKLLSNLIADWNNFLLSFDWLGLWVSEKDQARMDEYQKKNVYFAKTITLTPFGRKIVPILMKDRALKKWNRSFRQEIGEVNPIPGSRLPEPFNEDMDHKNWKKDQSSEPFYQAFSSLFFQRELQQTLPRLERKFTSGVHTFTIAFGTQSWRKVALSAKHTMEDLHQIILSAYEFEDGHLYSFFMDGKKWSSYCIASPFDHSGSANAAKTTIGSVGMHVGQRFMYLFDYGAEWQFTVSVEQISETEPEPMHPAIIDGEGTGPEQYFFD